MLGDGLVIAVDLALAGIQSAANGHACGADGKAAAHRLVAAGVAAAVLQAFDIEIATHFGRHLLAADHRPLEAGVATGLEGDAVACRYMGVGVGEVVRSRPVDTVAESTPLMMPARLSKSCRAASLTSLQDIWPPRFWMFSAVMFKVLRPAMLPLLMALPERIRFTPEAASKVPVPTRSPGLDPYIHLRNQNALPGAIG